MTSYCTCIGLGWYCQHSPVGWTLTFARRVSADYKTGGLFTACVAFTSLPTFHSYPLYCFHPSHHPSFFFSFFHSPFFFFSVRILLTPSYFFSRHFYSFRWQFRSYFGVWPTCGHRCRRSARNGDDTRKFSRAGNGFKVRDGGLVRHGLQIEKHRSLWHPPVQCHALRWSQRDDVRSAWCQTQYQYRRMELSLKFDAVVLSRIPGSYQPFGYAARAPWRRK